MFLSSNLILLCLGLASAFPAVLGIDVDDIILRVFVPLAEDLTPDDVQAIEEVKDTMRRKLRQSERKLDPAWCDSVCAGWPFPYCQVWQPQCYDHRRRNLVAGDVRQKQEESRNGFNRQLFSSNNQFDLKEVQGSDCDSTKKKVLDMLESAMTSSTSQSIVDDSHMTCYTLIGGMDQSKAAAKCEIQRFDLFNSHTDTIVESSGLDDDNDLVVCTNDSNDFSIEAVMQDWSCDVNSVMFHLEGPNGINYVHTESSVPYFLFGDDGRGNVFGGAQRKTLASGEYKLTVMPDGDSNFEQKIEFSLRHDC